ncbi:MAG: DUF2236 domain-containing protein [Actinomycetota bacterium]|nr:DUF2236 domain-containing protein [Actinomycetota bacterium]
MFGPSSEVWRIGRERALVAAGPAALLLQLSHPLVAAGVAEHSGFHTDPLHRLRATLDATLTITFGDREQAATAAARIRSRHRRVTGRTRTAVGPFPAGTSYRAEMSRFGELLGVPQELLPRSFADFTDYMRSMDDAVLSVGPQARALAAEILSAGTRGLPWPLSDGVGGLVAVLTAGLLPPRLRADYGLRWGWRERQAFRAARLGSRTAIPALPLHVRCWPHYLSAQHRLQQDTPYNHTGRAPGQGRAQASRSAASHPPTPRAPRNPE